MGTTNEPARSPLENIGIVKCHVCNRYFSLISELHYVVVEEKPTGLVAALGQPKGPKIYDAIDCPFCGCQNLLGIRLGNYEQDDKQCPCEYGICDECNETEGSNDD